MRTHHLVAVLTAFGLSAAMAQEATPDTWTQLPSSKSRADLTREVAAARANGDLDLVRQYDVVDRHYQPVLSRTEVLADLQMWQRAGMASFGSGEASASVHGPEYRAAHARYVALRASPEYAALVQSIAQRRGEVVLVARPGAAAR